jgi:hypothetical protein
MVLEGLTCWLSREVELAACRKLQDDDVRLELAMRLCGKARRSDASKVTLSDRALQ